MGGKKNLLLLYLTFFWYQTNAVPTPAPTYGSHCKRAGECIDLNSNKFCCTGNCRLVASSDCGYRCLAADVDDAQASDDIAVCNYHSRTPTNQPSTFQPTTSECLRGGECMKPNTTCCSGFCHNADQHCPYHYRCNSWDDDTGNIETNDYCAANLKKVHDDTQDATWLIWLIWGIVAIVVVCVIACIISCCCKKSDVQTINHSNGANYVVMTDNTTPFVTSEPIQPVTGVLVVADEQEISKTTDEYA
mmetsp:Transcript_52864/g.67800  ORF Transcript_52864/g.67800 Transcript_52864/m.67800 type:complete len:247 (+) Transcript_52864:43-783(+)